MAPLFHGVLQVTIQEANNLPANETLQSKVSGFFKSIVRQDHETDYLGVYVNIVLGDFRVATTSTFEHGDELNPKWAEHFRLDLAHETRDISFHIMGDRPGPDKTIGIVKFDGDDIMRNAHDPYSWKLLPLNNHSPVPIKTREWCQIMDKNGNVIPQAVLRLTMSFESVAEKIVYPHVLDTYFPSRQGCKVTLYQDAVTPHTDLFNYIMKTNGCTHQATNAFKDIYASLNSARNFIYILGWSVWADVVLVREDGVARETLGELLIRKSREGVRVLGMVWDEKASTVVTPGLMGTHDEETANYFKNTDVNIILVYRKKGGKPGLPGAGLAIDQLYSTCYSHHQKCVIVDADHPYNAQMRRVEAYVGGLDLTSGRYDDQSHNLFSTLYSTHRDDFYQNCVNVTSSCGPRQPWHDIHSKVEGRIAEDILLNFEERWRKQAPSKLKDKLVEITTNPMYDLNSTSFVPNGEEWHCQLFRSITSDSVNFDRTRAGSLTNKGKSHTENSIHRGYIHQIRRAQRFIYIENQYFLGSAYAWSGKNVPKAHHLVPFELVNKIASKIEANEQFHVYVVIPMFPEGDPGSAAIQEILHWQTSTMKMMYDRIAKTIKANGRPTKPTDYLSFYCLGKREAASPDYLPLPAQTDSTEFKLRNTRRFLIYVHSKMMIVDDSYIIVGSANINQRSMGGTRDTEIAVGSFQPYHMTSPDGMYTPKGDIFAFRMALFAEHLNTIEPVFNAPWCQECSDRIQEIAKINWDAYTSDSVMDTPGHLLRYPIKVDVETGSVSPLPNSQYFPDTKARILGTKSSLPELPDRLTT